MKFLVRFAILILIMSVLTTCKKYPNGPYFSLLTKKNRLAHDWRVDKAYKNAVDVSTQYKAGIASESFKLDGNGNFSYSIYATSGSGLSYSGTWIFNDDKSAFFTSYILGTQYITEAYIILRLKETDLWLQIDDRLGDRWEKHFIRN